MYNVIWNSHVPALNKFEKQNIVDRLNEKAIRRPSGFDISFPTKLRKEILNFLKEEVKDIAFTEVEDPESLGDTFIISVAQNEEALSYRESLR